MTYRNLQTTQPREGDLNIQDDDVLMYHNGKWVSLEHMCNVTFGTLLRTSLINHSNRIMAAAL